MNYPIFDSEDAVDRVDGDIEFLADITKDFLNSFPFHFAEIELAIKTSDPLKAEQKAHSLKGALNNLGGKKSADSAEAVEFAGRKADFAAIEKSASELLKNVQEFALEFNAFISKQRP